MTVVAQGSGRLEAIARPRSVFQRTLNLTRELAITQFKLKYTGSALGYVWSLVKPLMLFGIMYLVFSVLLKTGGNDTDFPVELLFGIVIWTFFVESTTLAMNAIAGDGDLIRKAYFPRWILVVSSTASAALSFVINTLLVIVVTLLLGKLHLSWVEPARAALLHRAHRAGARALTPASVRSSSSSETSGISGRSRHSSSSTDRRSSIRLSGSDAICATSQG